MPFAAINGIQLHYESAGAGTPVVFLHGLGSSAADWALQVPAFAERHQTLTVDLRAHGRSAYAGTFSIEQMADDVAGLLTHLTIDSAHIVGLSMGGCVALAMALRHGARVRSLTLVNTFARYQPAGWGGLRRGLHRLWLLQFRTIRDVAALVASGLFPLPEQQPLYDAALASLSQNSRATYWAALHALRRFDARPQLAAIRCPALVVMGDRDGTVPRAAGERLARGIPGAQSLVVANSGHATPMDQAGIFNAAVLEFLSRVEQTRAGTRLDCAQFPS